MKRKVAWIAGILMVFCGAAFSACGGMFDVEESASLIVSSSDDSLSTDETGDAGSNEKMEGGQEND